MKNFIICFKNEIKEELLKKGFLLLSEKDMSNKKIYTFANPKNLKFSEQGFKNMNFKKSDIIYTDKMFF